ncbi:MAG: glycosyltransferase family 4 protein, partial [Candidatus Thermoplasmatota archaeon]|nr:glycosyltransferase family 4 protein [Candidatus Thermoplasmatota archaeon]
MGGDAIFVGYLANELARRGHEVHVAYDPSVFRILRGDVPQSQQEDRMERIMRHEYSPAAPRLKLSLSLTLGVSSRARTWLESTAKRLSPDVIHWHNTKGFIGRPFAIIGPQQLYTAHDYYSVCPRSNLIRPGNRICLNPYLCQMCLIRWRRPPQIWRARGRRVLEFPERFKVLCPSEFMAERLRTDGILVHRVLRGFVPDPGPGAGGTSQRGETIVFVGILERRKGPHTLLQAFINSKVDQRFKLAIVGEGPLKGELRARVQSEGVQNRVSVPGFLASQDLRALMSQAALMVVPSEWPENAPSTALEAFSYGVSVLGTREGGLPEILTPESGSMLFEAGNVQELSKSLVALWGDRELLRTKGKMARKTYEERFSPEAHVTEYMRILKG